MLIAKLTTPIEVADYRAMFPNVGFSSNGPSDEFLAENNCKKVSVFKAHSATEKLIPSEPYVEGEWVYTVQVVDKTPEELQADELAAKQALQDSIVRAVEQRLNDFAKTRGYDDIKSASDYAAQSAVPKFQVEGQYALNQRAATWAKLYEILGEVEAGTRPVPSGYDDIKDELPELVWP